MFSLHIEVRKPAWRITRRRLLPPTVVTALVWIGLQVLVLLYLRSALGFLIEREPHLALEFHHALTTAPAQGLLLRTWIWATNLAFVVLLWFQFRSRPWPSRSQRALALLTYGGTALLLLLVNAAWNRLLSLQLPLTVERLAP